MTRTGTGFVDAAVAAFLRPPSSPASIAADAIRAIGLLSLIGAIVAWSGVSAAVFSLALMGQVAPRFLGARPGVDLAIGLGVYVAAASNVLDLYTRVSWWDIPVHVVTTGLLALLILLAADRAGVVFDRRRLPLSGLTITTGLALSALWEMGEWAGHTFVDPAISVGYDDTVIDMVAGGIGSALAAIIASRALRRSQGWTGR